jgi:hypothetical protein
MVAALASTGALARGEPATNGFDVDDAAVPRAEILGGGPPRDGIRSVDTPRFVAPGEVNWVRQESPVLSVTVDDQTHVYPVHLVEYHQVVNDQIAGRPVLLTYDPLAGVPRAFEGDSGGEAKSFGVSGLIHNHNFLLYDRETESLWQQISGEAIAGKSKGTVLRPIRVRQEPYGAALARSPRARVLARPSGKIDYAISPFQRYWQTNELLFPVKAQDDRFHLKEMVLGLRAAGRSRAYLGSLVTASGGVVEDEFAGKKVRFQYDAEQGTFLHEIPEGIEVIEAYWLAWKAFFPDTEIWHAPGPGSGE